MNFVSVIVPVKEINDCIRQELIPALEKQTFKNFELIIVPDKKKQKETFPSWVKTIPSWPKTGPAEKRDLGVKDAKGEFLAFIDDDAHPHPDWLKNALKTFKDSKVAAVCGPGVTPPEDSLRQQVSGWVWSTWLGAGGAGTYRNRLGEKRQVDDYPTFNLIVRKKDFQAVGGFDTDFWPGEDTKLCHDLVHKLGKKIVYDPRVLVYHHRRPVFLPHLKQIARFGLHRGYFSKILPRTSKRLGYFVPLLFTFGLVCGPISIWLLKIAGLAAIYKIAQTIYGLSLSSYLVALLITSASAAIKSQSLTIGLMLVPSIILSHLVYGVMFAKGLLVKNLKS